MQVSCRPPDPQAVSAPPGTTGKCLNGWELFSCLSHFGGHSHTHPESPRGRACPGGGQGGPMGTVREGEVHFPGAGPVPGDAPPQVLPSRAGAGSTRPP